MTAHVESSLASVEAGPHFQFEGHGYFVTDLEDHLAGKAVFNRVTEVKDSWANNICSYSSKCSNKMTTVMVKALHGFWVRNGVNTKPHNGVKDGSYVLHNCGSS